MADGVLWHRLALAVPWSSGQVHQPSPKRSRQRPTVCSGAQ